jgi:hypothetical protein
VGHRERAEVGELLEPRLGALDERQVAVPEDRHRRETELDGRRRRPELLADLVGQLVPVAHHRLDEVGVDRPRGAVGGFQHDLVLLRFDGDRRVGEADRAAIPDDLLELHGVVPLSQLYLDNTVTTIAAASRPRKPPPVLRQRHPSTRHLPRPAPAPQLVGELDELTASGGPDRMTLGQQAAAGVDHPAPAQPGLAGPEQLGPLPRGAQAELLVGELGRCGRVVQLHDVEVLGPDPAEGGVHRLLRLLRAELRPVPRLLQSDAVQLRDGVHHVDPAFFEKYYDGSSVTPQINQHMDSWH